MNIAKNTSSSIANLCLFLLIISTICISYLPGGHKINLMVGVGFSVIVVLISFGRNRSLKFYREIILLIIWLGYAVLPSLIAPRPEAAISKLLTMSQIVILVFLVVNVITWSKNERYFMWSFVAGSIGSFLVSFTSFSGVELEGRVVGEVAGRTVGTLRNANTFAIVMVQAEIFLAYLWIGSEKKIEKLLIITSSGILAYAIISSGSRTGVISFTLLCIAVGWTYRVWRLSKPKTLITYCFLITILIAVSYNGYQQSSATQMRFDALINILASGGDLSQEGASASIRGRSSLALKAINTAMKHPLGIGLDNFDYIAGTYAHSNYLEILACTGIIGLIIYYSIYISLLIKVRKLIKKSILKVNQLEVRFLFSFPIIIMIMDIPNVSYYSKDIWLSIGIIIATIKINNIKVSKQNN